MFLFRRFMFKVLELHRILLINTSTDQHLKIIFGKACEIFVNFSNSLCEISVKLGTFSKRTVKIAFFLRKLSWFLRMNLNLLRCFIYDM